MYRLGAVQFTTSAKKQHADKAGGNSAAREQWLLSQQKVMAMHRDQASDSLSQTCPRLVGLDGGRGTCLLGMLPPPPRLSTGMQGRLCLIPSCV